MKIFSWNVNGIRAVIKKGVFQPFLEKFRPDIVCLQETKAERGQFEIDLPDYREYWNSAVKKGYSPNAKDDLSRLPLRSKHWDPAFLAYCKQLEKTKPVIFCGVLDVAHTELDLANPKPNRGKKGFTDEERAGFQNLLDAGFVDTFRLFTQGNGHYSWWSPFANSRARNVGWRIDYVLVSRQLR